MKKTPSELAFEALLSSVDSPPEMRDLTITSDILSGISSGDDGVVEAVFFSQSVCVAPNHSTISPAVDSHSSLCVSSPTSACKPDCEDNQPRSDSSHQQSEDDDEDLDIEVGPCEQSSDPHDIKRLRRMVSNRESAKRSRRRKQAHLQDLESQVQVLKEENGTLVKELANASQHFKDSVTSYQALKSYVDALRDEVKQAEDRIAQGSVASNFNRFFQNHFSSPQLLNPPNPCRLPSVFPTGTVHGDDASYAAQEVSGQNSGFGLEHTVGVNSGLISDALSCISGLWPAEFASTMSK